MTSSVLSLRCYDGNKERIFFYGINMSQTAPSFSTGQLLHFGFLILAVPALVVFSEPAVTEWLGISVSVWFWLALAVPIIHQIYVWVCWRLQLQQQFFTKNWGMKKGFLAYTIVFFLLFGSRFISLLLLAIADQDSISMSVVLRGILATPILIVGGYAMFSVKQYFGFRRAAGIDHFDPEYRNKPLVRQGIFKWTNNAMYVFALQLLWLFGIVAASKLAMIAAGFQSIYIWVHYFATEKPDMNWIYR
jgi:protein-S-isoprenylcysteine O-methyltransferase Ste14